MKKQETGISNVRNQMKWWIVLTVVISVLIVLLTSSTREEVVQTPDGRFPASVSFVIPNGNLI